MVRKCRGVAEIAVMEVDVRTRAQANLDVPASSSGSAKKRKISSEEFESSTTSYVKLRSRRRQVLLPKNSVSISTAPPESILGRPETLTDHVSSRPSSDDDSRASFCCSSNGSSELVEESSEFVDLEDENDEVEEVTYIARRERRETTPTSQFRSRQSDDMESTAKKNEATSAINGSLSEKMPTESELEEFFIAAEKNIQKRFADKYNYDIAEDVPLEGRYEWIRLKP